jgi:hypothetical protein
MRDPIATAFSRFDVEPEPGFVAELRRQAVAELSRAVDGDGRSPGDAPEITVVQPSSGRAQRSDRPRRWWLTMVAAAAVVAVVITLPILRRDDRLRIASPGQATGFSKHLSGDLTITDATSVHFEADVALSQAIEADEIGVSGHSDILLLPRITLNVTTPAGNVELTEAYVQVFLRSDVATCIVNTTGCDPAIVRGIVDPGQQPAEVTPDHGLDFTDSTTLSRIRVSTTSVPTIVREVSTGTAVVGAAVVISAGAPNQTVSAIFDSDGHQVLICDGAPADCMDSSRSVLTGTVGAAPDAAAIPTFPPGDVPPGTYAPEGPVVPYSITTVASWQLLGSSESTAFLGRGTNQSTELAITEERRQGISTPADAIEEFCPEGSVDFGPTTATTLLGRPALRAEGPVVSECATRLLPALAGTQYRRLQAVAGATVRITAADVDGTVVVVIAVAPTDDWTTFAVELDATTLRKL